jgi:hypothetical protein
MGGACSQKLRPWRGRYSSPGRSNLRLSSTLYLRLMPAFSPFPYSFSPADGGAVATAAYSFLKPVPYTGATCVIRQCWLPLPEIKHSRCGPHWSRKDGLLPRRD